MFIDPNDKEQAGGDGGEGQTDDLEIEISNEDLSTSESMAAEEQQAKNKTLEEERKKKNRVPADKRIGQLTRKNHELSERATGAETHAQKLARDLEDERGKRGVSDKAALTNYARAADLNLKLAKKEHEEALNSGEADKITEAASKLAAASTEKQNVDNFMERTKATEAAQPKADGTRTSTEQPDRTETRRPTREEIEANMPEETLKWTRETKWFDPSSEEHDADKHKAAVMYAANVLEPRYRRAGKTGDIGTTAEYFKEIDSFIAKEFGEDDDETVDVNDTGGRKVPSMQAGRQDNGGVSRSTPGSGGNGSGKIKVALTQDENDQIRRNMEAGAIVDPKTNKRVTDFKVAQHRFAMQKHRIALLDKSKNT